MRGPPLYGPPQFGSAYAGLVAGLAAALLSAALWAEDLARQHATYREVVSGSVRDLERDLREVEALEGQIARYFQVLGPMGRAEFADVAAPLLQEGPHRYGLIGLSWNPSLQEQDRAAFEAEVRAVDGRADFQLREFAPDGSTRPATARPDYVAVRFIEPFEPNRGALGLDISSDPTRRAALLASRDSGEPRMSAPIHLVQDRDRLGALVMWPVYDGVGPFSPEERAARLRGFLVGVLALEDLVDRAFAPVSDAGPTWLRDVTDPAAPLTLHGGPVSEPWTTYRFSFAGRSWEALARPGDAWVTSNRSQAVYASLLTALASVVLLVAYVRHRERERRALRDSRERLVRVLEFASDAVVGLDAQGRVLHWNAAAVSMFGLPAAEARGRDFGAMVSAKPGEALPTGIIVALRASGERFPADLTVSDPGGPGPLVRFAFVRDLSARERADEEARHLHRLEAIGQLTGQLAHDFNNILGIISGSLEMVEARVQDDARARRWLDTALRAVHRGAAITRSLLALARRRSADAGLHDLNVVVESTLQLARATVGRQITLRSFLCAGELVAHLDSAALTNVILNLLNNARDACATSPRKEILVNTRRADLREGPEPHGPVALIEIRDTGVGLSEEVKARAFEPFYTTKEPGKGTGLGLAMVADFVKGVGGRVDLKSTEGGGATVTLVLPLDAEATRVSDEEEADRLAALRALAILDTPAEPRFDEIARQAASQCGTSMGLISLVDEHRQWFKARFGLEVRETSRAEAFCAHVIQQEESPVVVQDASQDARFSGNPLVVASPSLRFYAGVPIHEPGGAAIGTLCVLDPSPHQLQQDQIDALHALAQQVERLIATRGEEHAEGSPDRVPSEGRNARILLVEDEAAYRELTQSLLEEAGFEVVPAASGEAALERALSERFDLVLTDVIMPGLDGLELARRLAEPRPSLKVVFCSGHTDQPTGSLVGPVLEKPYRGADLVAFVESALQGSGAGGWSAGVTSTARSPSAAPPLDV